MMEANFSNIKCATIDGNVVGREHFGDLAVITGIEFVEFDVLDEFENTQRLGKGQRSHRNWDWLGGDPRRHDIIGREREMVIVIVPRSASASGFFRQYIVVVEA